MQSDQLGYSRLYAQELVNPLGLALYAVACGVGRRGLVHNQSFGSLVIEDRI